MTNRAPRRRNNWQHKLFRTVYGNPKPILANALIALREAPAWIGVLAFDEFAQQSILMSAPPWDAVSTDGMPRRITNNDDILITEWLQKHDITVSCAVAAQAAEAVAREHPIHPVKTYLEGLLWDGVPRLNTWLIDYFGADNVPLTAEVGRCIMIAAVARIYQPGCKVDNVPIFEGAQGIGKSSALRALFDPWFADELADPGSKDAAMQTHGVWMIEWSELDSMTKSETATTKAFVTRQTDRYRPPYAHRVSEIPRSCVFWGTTNAEEYLTDETGARRFWPIKVRKINLGGIRRIRDQLFAEAREHYFSRMPWWIVDSDLNLVATDEQRKRYSGDAWEETIIFLASTRNELSIDEVFLYIGVETSRRDQRAKNRIARCLKALGWSRVQIGAPKTRRWVYRNQDAQ